MLSYPLFAQCKFCYRVHVGTTDRKGRNMKQEDQSEKLLTVQEVAKGLKVDETTVRRWIEAGILEAVTLPHVGNRKVYRIKKSVYESIRTPRRLG